ncbi:addiction module protein [Prosthecobacter vanneervenii]|uniref:Uncharacterized protein n=1 Tax=Prosthecobacter vanneervenii TaxID=48466 RepID=A0A7W7YEN1_9BACT|nr:addiction module protein [Prosthecobacter vanneervenii]MBB5034632.1 hypothetical protein [Prosthecobacter vanneervenii]
MSEHDDETSGKTEWEAEIDARVKEIQEGRVKLVSADEAIARVRSRLAARRAGLSYAGCSYVPLGGA